MKIDMTGQRYGNWTVLQKDTSQHGKRNSYWLCRCDCGTTRVVTRTSLISGRSLSCGCRPSPNRKGINKTHGMSGTRIHHEWLSMRRRCSSPDIKCAESYYGKGIRVCDEWDNDFLQFYKWAMDNGYSDALTIDRIDNSKGYSPDNCRWVTFAEQQRNKTNNIFVEYNGELWCMRTLCERIGFPYKLANRRYNRAKKKGKILSSEELFSPVHTEKIAYKYRKSK